MKGLLLAAALVAAGCSRHDTDSQAIGGKEAARLLVDRNWIDVWPTSKDDRIHVYRFTPGMGGGIYQDRTVFKGEFELFLFKVREDDLEFYLPHEDEKVHTRYRIERVDGPEPFDLRLTLDRSPRGPRVYYGRRAEHASLDAELAQAVE